MKTSRASRVLVCYVLLLLIATSLYANIGAQSPLGGGKPAGPFPSGMLLFAPVSGSTTYLMDSNGTINHTWPCTYTPQLAPYWIGNGSIVYPINNGGGLEKIAWNGTVTWVYQFNRPGSYCHHDIVPLPNGDVLMIVQEVKTHAEAVAAGRNPATVGDTFLPDYLIEVKPTGPTSGTIVWEWHQWDHLIQDYDSSKQNYGVVGDHPELIDINFGEYFTGDWIHTNSVDYNPAFDQILISAHDFDEVWIIDHSTTTQEAAGHTGGRYGHGGDLLYRWGNPKAYRRGDASDEKMYFEHQCTWIKPGLPGAGDILIYDNGNNRPGGPYSTVDEFTPTVSADGYYYINPGEAYGPDNFTWSYVATPPQSMYSSIYSGAQRLLDGNTMICVGVPGQFIEVSPDDQVVWQYTNPFPDSGDNSVFKVEYIPPTPPEKPNLDAIGRLVWTDVKPGAVVNGSFQVVNIGDSNSRLNWKVDKISLGWGNWTIAPESGVNLTPEEGPVTVHVQGFIPDKTNKAFQGSLLVLNQDNTSDNDTVPVIIQTSLSTPFSPAHPFFDLLRYWLSYMKNYVWRHEYGSLPCFHTRVAGGTIG